MRKTFILIGTILCFIFLVHFVSAVECGSIPTNGCTITQNTNFTNGTYNLPSGVRIITSGITLDCQNSTLIGDGGVFSYGILLQGSYNSNTIKNCNFEGYRAGIYFRRFNSGEVPNNNLMVNNSFKNNTDGIHFTTSPQYNIVKENYFENNGQGVYLDEDLNEYPNNNNITENYFINSSGSDINLRDDSNANRVWTNNIWNNTITHSITYTHTSENNYVIDGVENVYLNNATGPTSEGVYLYQGLIINSNRNYRPGNYTFTGVLNALSIQAGVTFDCNNSISLTGDFNSFGMGIRLNLYNSASNGVVKNCIIRNFGDGIQIREDAFAGGANNITLINNTFENNAEAIYIEGDGSSFNILKNKFTNGTGVKLDNNRGNPILHNITLNLFNLSSVSIESGSNQNNVFNNNFINSTGNDDGSLNNWNLTNYGGNYWSLYDSISEGCVNLNNDLFCDDPYNLTGPGNNKDYKPYIVEDGWLAGLQASEPIPVQVVADVDMVKGKNTFIRIPITFKGMLSNDTIIPNVTVYWNGNFIGQNITSNFEYNESKNIDFWYAPQNSGANMTIVVMVNGTSSNGINYFDSNSKTVNVLDEKKLDILYVPINSPLTFDEEVNKNKEIIQTLYPVADNMLGTYYSENIELNVSSSSGIAGLILRLAVMKTLSGLDRSVGVVENGWFATLGQSGAKGISMFVGGFGGPGGVIIEESEYSYIAAHEIGHTYGLCDEYDNETWNEQNTRLSSSSKLCPNGDEDNDELLDESCLPYGCQVTTFGEIVPWNESNGEITLMNLMGSTDSGSVWISKDSYNELLNDFENINQFSSSGILVSGFFNRTSNQTEFANFYIMDQGLFIKDINSGQGNFSIGLSNGSGYLISNFSFDIPFSINYVNGSSEETDIGVFLVALNYSNEISKVSLSYYNTTQSEKSRTLNNPEIFGLPNLSGFKISNSLINLSWNATDSDNDTLVYSLLFSKDNGESYTVLSLDYPDQFILLNSSNLPDCDFCKLKVLVTDGFNTNYTVSEPFTIDNDLSIDDLRVIYQNNTQRIFRFGINNTFVNKVIDTIYWSLDFGESIINSSINITLEGSEESFIYVYYNYNVSGGYNIKANAYNGIYLDTSNITVNI